MKAVFIQQATLLRDSHVDTSSEGDWQLMPATIEAVKAYATLGEVVEVLREQFGTWRPSADF